MFPKNCAKFEVNIRDVLANIWCYREGFGADVLNGKNLKL